MTFMSKLHISRITKFGTLPLPLILTLFSVTDYRLGTVNSKSFVCKVLLQIKRKFKLTVHFKHEMIKKIFTETS